MPDLLRQEVIALATTVVVKVGTNVLTDERGRLDRTRIQGLCDQLVRLRGAGRRVALVSSGAIGAGVGRLGLAKRPTDLRELQACAAVGQNALMQLYQECLPETPVAQMLLTAGDFDNRVRYLNVRNTLLTLFEWGSLPVINENDTVSVAEIKFGDNDHLAAMVANLLRANLLVLLTNVDGLYDRDPAQPGAERLTVVPEIDRNVTDLATSTRSALGTGGMRSKLRAARLVTAAGEPVVMANGATPGILDQVFAAELVGTLFLPHGGLLSAKKRWLGFTARPKGRLILDAGAARAVRAGGKSLLPVGVRAVSGSFGKGDVVALVDEQGTEVARGLSNYAAADAARLCGLNTEQVIAALGRVPYTELVHRDNLAVIE